VELSDVKTRTHAIQLRIDALKSELDQLRPGDTLNFSELTKRLKKRHAKETTESQLRYALTELRKEIEARDYNLSLEVGRDYVRLLAKEETTFDQNLQLNVPQKRAIGAVLWHWLFDFPLPEDIKFLQCWMGTESLKFNERIKNRLEHKKLILRSRISLGLVVDAGSTNAIAVEQFLRSAKDVPFQIGTQKSESGVAINSKKLVAPLFVTNSIVIADKIARSRFRHAIPLRVIGGTERPDRKSICGELALLWLRACHHEGKMISLDLAIIGATGIESSRYNPPALGCDSAEEQGLKSRLLAMSHFRIVVMDSSKIVSGSNNSVFANVSDGDIDLIVTDCGADQHAREKVGEFAAVCAENGVGLLCAIVE
jgi:DeoR/GlpR family transcriptional regulator of sugar metabolism